MRCLWPSGRRYACADPPHQVLLALPLAFRPKVCVCRPPPLSTMFTFVLLCCGGGGLPSQPLVCSCSVAEATQNQAHRLTLVQKPAPQPTSFAPAAVARPLEGRWLRRECEACSHLHGAFQDPHVSVRPLGSIENHRGCVMPDISSPSFSYVLFFFAFFSVSHFKSQFSQFGLILAPL